MKSFIAFMTDVGKKNLNNLFWIFTFKILFEKHSQLKKNVLLLFNSLYFNYYIMFGGKINLNKIKITFKIY